MARRATTPAKKQTKAQRTASARMSEPGAAKAPRGRRNTQSAAPEPTVSSLTDIVPVGEETTETAAEVGSNPTPKVRRKRQPKAADGGVQAENAAPEAALSSDDEPSTVQANSRAAPLKTRRRQTQSEGQPEASKTSAAAPQPIQQTAARWNADTGTATFDWPSIEQVAEKDGPNQAMAKLLLAARAEGANSRWPF